jgi:lysophospholipase L1-like esterase
VASDRAVIACLGSSATAAKGSYDWIGDLQSRPENAAKRFLNFGVGGDLAYNALQRLPAVARCNPGTVVVLIGGNDILTLASRKLRRFLAGWKRFPHEPTSGWYEENLRCIVRELKGRLGTTVALCSLQPMGEDPSSQDPFQSRLNELVHDYSAIVHRVAQEENAVYIPFYERFSDAIRASPGPALTDIKILSMYRDAFRHFLLGWNLDQIAERNGWRFHTDGIHLNSRGGKLLADVVQLFLATG